MRKRLDIYFIENKLIAKALDEYYLLMAKTLDTDDFISKKVDASIKEMIESKFKSDLRMIRKEVKRYLKKRNKAIKRGEIYYDAEFNAFLESIGVDFGEFSNWCTNDVEEETTEEEIEEAREALLGTAEPEETETTDEESTVDISEPESVNEDLKEE